MDLCEAPDLPDVLLIQPGWNVVGRGGALGVAPGARRRRGAGAGPGRVGGGGVKSLGIGVTQSWAQSQFYRCLAQAPFLHLESGTSNKTPVVELVQGEVSRSWASHAWQVKTVIPFGLGLEP